MTSNGNHLSNDQKIDFSDKAVTLWLVVYDNSPDRTYTFTDPKKVLASVEGSIKSYAADSGDEEEEEHNSTITLEAIRKVWNQPYIPIKYLNLEIAIIRIELDKHTKMHSILNDCFDLISNPQNWEDDSKRITLLASIGTLFRRQLR